MMKKLTQGSTPAELTSTKPQVWRGGRNLVWSITLLAGILAIPGWSVAGTDQLVREASREPASAAKTWMASPAIKLAPIKAEKVDLNTATAEQLAQVLSGVGIAKAKAIVTYRKEIGPFRTVDEPEEVKGIGPSIVLRNKGRILLDEGK